MQADLSIIMAAHNSSKTLRQAIDSLLGQTYQKFKLIIVNDGSTDDTESIIKSYDDKRIIYLKNDVKTGAAAARNRALDIADTEFIAIFDSDDIARENKFEKQIDFLNNNNQYGLIASSADIIDENGKKTGEYKLGADDDVVKANMLFRNYFIHSSVVFRRNVGSGKLRYDENLIITEDYDYLNRVLRLTKGYISGEVLLSYRIHSENTMNTLSHQQYEYDKRVFLREFKEIGIDASESEISLHLLLKNDKNIRSFKELKRMKNWLIKLWEASSAMAYYNPESLRKVFINRWLKVCRKCINHPFLVLWATLHIPLFISLKSKRDV